MSNRRKDGSQFSPAEIQAVWEKAQIIYYIEKDSKRKDRCGATILRNEYGNTNSSFGWEIDHIYPASLGGSSDDLSNLQPLQWKNNRSKGDSTSGNYCVVTTWWNNLCFEMGSF